jgi:hypothetical protein
LTVDADITEQYEYAVHVFDHSRGRRLVAAVEIVSPANKDRPENRRAFVAKCTALLQQQVCVAIVDLVTTRNFNLYAELLAMIERADPSPAGAAAIYAASCRGRKLAGVPQLQNWAYALAVGAPLPTLPLWLTGELAVELNLEASYEQTCRVLRIR